MVLALETISVLVVCLRDKCFVRKMFLFCTFPHSFFSTFFSLFAFPFLSIPFFFKLSLSLPLPFHSTLHSHFLSCFLPSTKQRFQSFYFIINK